jgi:hypothetical protein
VSHQFRLNPADLDRDDLERLAGLPAWERARTYEALGLGFADRQLIELAVRALIRADYEREHGRGKRRAA